MYVFNVHHLSTQDSLIRFYIQANLAPLSRSGGAFGISITLSHQYNNFYEVTKIFTVYYIEDIIV